MMDRPKVATHVEHQSKDLMTDGVTVPALRQLDGTIDTADDESQTGKRDAPRERLDPARGEDPHARGRRRVGCAGRAAAEAGVGTKVEVEGDEGEDDHRHELEDNSGNHGMRAGERGVGVVIWRSRSRCW